MAPIMTVPEGYKLHPAKWFCYREDADMYAFMDLGFIYFRDAILTVPVGRRLAAGTKCSVKFKLETFACDVSVRAEFIGTIPADEYMTPRVPTHVYTETELS